MSPLTILMLLCVVFGLSVIFRRYQIRAAKRTRLDSLGARILANPLDQANRQQLADILKDWDSLSAGRAGEVMEYLKDHPRLNGVDLTDPAARRRAYEGLVGISPGKSPEK